MLTKLADENLVIYETLHTQFDLTLMFLIFKFIFQTFSIMSLLFYV